MTGSSKGDVAGGKRLLIAAVAAMVLLIADILLYPDTFTYAGLHLFGFRISPMKVFLVITAPVIALYVWKNIGLLRLRALDYVLLATIAFVSMRGIIGAQSSTVMGLILAYMGYAVTLYYGAAVLGQKRQAHNVFIWLLVGLGVPIAGYAIVEFYAMHNIYEPLISEIVADPYPNYHRSGSTVGHPLVLGLLLIQIVPFAVYFYMKEHDYRRQAAWILAIIILALGLTVTMSRGPWLTAVFLSLIASIWYLWRRPDARKKIIVLLTSVLLVISVFTLFNYETLNSGTMSNERKGESINPRIYMWSRVPTAFLKHPLIGVGMLQGGYEVSRTEPIEPNKRIPVAVDNIYLTTLVDEGIVGTVLMGGTLLLLVLQVVKLLRRKGKYTGYAAVLTFSVAAVLVEGTSTDSMLFWANAVVFWLVAGLIRAMVELQEDPASAWN